MITDALIYFIFSILIVVIGLFPTGTLPAQVASAITTMWGYFEGMGVLLPVTTILAGLKFVLGFEIAMLGADFFVWVYVKIWGSR